MKTDSYSHQFQRNTHQKNHHSFALTSTPTLKKIILQE
nr:MAG TPA: hypothetical protein [Bacteriophage sp.]